MINYWPLLGIALVVLGFALRFNPLLVVAVAAIVTGLLRRMPFLKVLATLGHGFNENRYVTDHLHRPAGDRPARTLRAAAAGADADRRDARRDRRAAADLYLGFRQIFAALGLTSVAGHAQTVRPLVAPMAIAAAEKQHGELDEATSERVKAMSAATDNVGLFFGEDIFLAIASILLIQGVAGKLRIQLTPFQLSVWAIPTAICAFLIHGARLLLLDRRAAERRPSDQPPLALRPRRRRLRRLRDRQRARRDQPQALGQCRFLGACSRSASGLAIFLGDIGNGLLVLALVAIAGIHLLGRGIEGIDHRRAARSAFPSATATSCSCPALVIPFTAFVGTLVVQLHAAQGQRPDRSEGGHAGAARLRRDHRADRLLRLAPSAGRSPPSMKAAGSMNRSAGPRCLPQMLASLGAVFAAAGVGTTIGAMASAIIPHGQHLPRRAAVRARHGRVHDDHGQRFRRFPGDGGGDRRSDPHPPGRRQSGGDRRGRDAVGLLRDADDPDGRQLQHRPGRAARAEGSIWRDPGADPDGDPAC